MSSYIREDTVKARLDALEMMNFRYELIHRGRNWQIKIGHVRDNEFQV